MIFSRLPVRLLVCTVLFISAGAGEPRAQEQKPAAGSEGAKAAFERFKQLVGDWEYADPKDEDQKGKIVARYTLTAAGSTVVETILPGDEKEMMRVYHRDGNDLKLTH